MGRNKFSFLFFIQSSPQIINSIKPIDGKGLGGEDVGVSTSVKRKILWVRLSLTRWTER